VNAKMKKATFMFLALLTVIGATYGANTFTFIFNERATVGVREHIRVWLDASKTIELQSGGTFDWGTVVIGANTESLWIENDGTVSVILNLVVSASLPVGWTETWNYDGTPVTVGETRSVTITLTVPSGATAGTYSWSNSQITATQA